MYQSQRKDSMAQAMHASFHAQREESSLKLTHSLVEETGLNWNQYFPKEIFIPQMLPFHMWGQEQFCFLGINFVSDVSPEISKNRHNRTDTNEKYMS